MTDLSETEAGRSEGRPAGITRRQAVQGAACLCLFAALPAWAQDAANGPQPGDLLVAKNDDTLTPLTPDDIDPEATKSVIAVPLDPATNTTREGNLAKVLLVRFDPVDLDEETAARSFEGIVAYSAICTHAGCEVTTFKPSDGTLTCPCHGSKFDPLNDGKVLTGPAKAPLASIALKVEDGRLIIAGPFEGEVGAQS